jgi:hypothetical protein
MNKKTFREKRERKKLRSKNFDDKVSLTQQSEREE